MTKMIWASLAIATLALSACIAPSSSEPTSQPATATVESSVASAATPAGGLLPPESPPAGAEREFSTDFSRHTVSYAEVFSGGPPKDGIPAIDVPKFVTVAEADEWLRPSEPVVLVQVGDDARAYPLQILTWHEIVNDTVGGQPVAVFWQPGVASALDSGSIAQGRDVGSAAAFSPELDGRSLTFISERGRIVDAETRSTWNLLGLAVEGELAGQQLTPVVSINHFWFSWAAFRPETRIYQP